MMTQLTDKSLCRKCKAKIDINIRYSFYCSFAIDIESDI